MDNSIEKGKKIAIVAYITMIGTIVAYYMNTDEHNEFAKFHIRQAFGIYLTFFLLGYLISGFDNWSITFTFWTFIFILWLFGFMQALQGRTQPIPLLGKLFQKLFS